MIVPKLIKEVCAFTAAVLLPVLLATGCNLSPGGVEGAPPDDDKPQVTPISVRLSDLTPEPAQGKVVLIDYEGPAFDESDLRISLGGEALHATVADDQISVLLPLSHAGPTSLAVDFGGGKSTTLTLDISAAPPIPNPRQLLETETAKIASTLSGLVARESDLQELYDAVLTAQEQLTKFDEQEIAYAATLYKQNIGTSLEQPVSAGVLQTATSRAPGFDSAKCKIARNAWIKEHAYTAFFSTAGGLLLTVPSLEAKLVGLLFVAEVARKIPDMLDKTLYVAVICLRSDGIVDIQSSTSTGNASSSRSIYTVQASTSSSLPRVSFVDGEPLALTITVAYRIEHDIRTEFLNALSKLRDYLSRFINNTRSICASCAAWVTRQAERIPDSVEKEEPAPASGFVLKNVSNENVTGQISGRDGTRLSLTFTVADSYVPGTQDFIDFNFTLANSSVGITDTSIPGRVELMSEPEFDATVGPQTYDVDSTIEPLVLPAARGGNNPLTYSLTPDVPGLRFEPRTRTLSGTPTTAGTYTMTYTVTDTDGDSVTLSFEIEVSAAQQVTPTFHEPIMRFYPWNTPVNVPLPKAGGDAGPYSYSLLFRRGALLTGMGLGADHHSYDSRTDTGFRFDRNRNALVGSTRAKHWQDSRVAVAQRVGRGYSYGFLYLAKTQNGDIAAKMYGSIFVMDEDIISYCGCNSSGCSNQTCPSWWTTVDTKIQFPSSWPEGFVLFDQVGYLRGQQMSLPLPQPYLQYQDGNLWARANAPLTYSLTPDVPGLRFDSVNRTLSGRPTAVGTYAMTYNVTDVDGDSDTLPFTLKVVEDQIPSFHTGVGRHTFEKGTPITPLVLPEATGGDPPLTYSLTPVVAGLRFHQGLRTLRGTPTIADIYAMTYEVTDVDGDADSFSFTIEVTENQAPSFHTGVAGNAFLSGTPIAPLVLPEATGGDPPLTYSLSPAVPGLRFDQASRTLSGTPTIADIYAMTYEVTDADGDADSLSFTIEVIEDHIPSFHTGVGRHTFEKGKPITSLVLPEATGGNLPLTYRLIPAVAGLQFDPGSRTLSGTPTIADIYAMTYVVTDIDGDRDVLSFSIEVVESSSLPPVAIGTIPSLSLSVGYTSDVEASAFFSDPHGDALTYTATSSDDTVASVGMVGSLVSIAATAGGTATVTITATNSRELSASQTIMVTVQSEEAPTQETRHYMIYNLDAEPSLKPEGNSLSCTPLPSSNWITGTVTGTQEQFDEYRDSLWNRLGCGCCCLGRFASSADTERSYGALALSYSFATPAANYYCFAGSGVGATSEEARNAALAECRRIGFSDSCRIVHEQYVPPTRGS